MSAKLSGLRHFPHSNSKRKQADRFKEDCDEIAEFTSSLPTLRNGARKSNNPACPNVYDDEWQHAYTKKWKTKPKENDVKRDTIRHK